MAKSKPSPHLLDALTRFTKVVTFRRGAVEGFTLSGDFDVVLQGVIERVRDANPEIAGTVSDWAIFLAYSWPRHKEWLENRGPLIFSSFGDMLPEDGQNLVGVEVAVRDVDMAITLSDREFARFDNILAFVLAVTPGIVKGE